VGSGDFRRGVGRRVGTTLRWNRFEPAPWPLTTAVRPRRTWRSRRQWHLVASAGIIAEYGARDLRRGVKGCVNTTLMAR
jgi:hypothetical protein